MFVLRADVWVLNVSLSLCNFVCCWRLARQSCVTEHGNSVKLNFLSLLNTTIILMITSTNFQPSNIFFAMDGTIKIGDFGLVTDVENMCDSSNSSTENGGDPDLSVKVPNGKRHTNQVGTQLYMSPELVRFYSFVTIYYYLTIYYRSINLLNRPRYAAKLD